jgi:hypothetical protein
MAARAIPVEGDRAIPAFGPVRLACGISLPSCKPAPEGTGRGATPGTSRQKTHSSPAWCGNRLPFSLLPGSHGEDLILFGSCLPTDAAATARKKAKLLHGFPRALISVGLLSHLLACGSSKEGFGDMLRQRAPAPALEEARREGSGGACVAVERTGRCVRGAGRERAGYRSGRPAWVEVKVKVGV